MRRITNRLAGGTVLALAATLTGCSSDSITGLGETFDANAAASLVETAVRPEIGNVTAGHASLMVNAVKNAPVASVTPELDGDRLAGLRDRAGAALGRKLGRVAALPAFSVAGRNGILPEGVLGKTFTLGGEVAGGYAVAGGPSDAPPDGVRFHIYELDPVTGRPKLIPPQWAGWVDMTEPVPNAGLRVVSRERDGGVFTDFEIARQRVETEEAMSSTFTSSGLLPGLDYTMRDHVAFTSGFTRVDFAFERELVLSGLRVTYDGGGYITSAENDNGQVRLVMTIEADGHTVVIDSTDDGIDVLGSITYDAQTQVLISGDPFDPTFTHPDGTPLLDGELNGAWNLWAAYDLALYFGDALLVPLSTLIP